jgi:protein transport protein SEC23
MLISRHVLGSEDCNNTLIMMQPTLMSYRPEQEPEPTLLDSVSIAPDVVLLLDTFFHVLIWHGETVAAWRKAGYHEQEGYEHIKEQIERPVADAAVSCYGLRAVSTVPRLTRYTSASTYRN